MIVMRMKRMKSMKYSELKNELKNLDYKVTENASEVRVWACGLNDVLLASVSKNVRYELQITSDFNSVLSDTVCEHIFNCVTQLANTPLEERTDEKKYNVVACRHKWGAKGKITEITRFYYRSTSNHLGVSGEGYNREADHQWSMEQIKDWGLEDCERIGVEEED